MRKIFCSYSRARLPRRLGACGPDPPPLSKKSNLEALHLDGIEKILALQDALFKLQRTMVKTSDTGGEIMRKCYAVPISASFT
jgi:hypothetical protein